MHVPFPLAPNNGFGPPVCWAGMAPCLEYSSAFTWLWMLGADDDCDACAEVPWWWIFLRTLHTSWRSASNSATQTITKYTLPLVTDIDHWIIWCSLCKGFRPWHANRQVCGLYQCCNMLAHMSTSCHYTGTSSSNGQGERWHTYSASSQSQLVSVNSSLPSSICVLILPPMWLLIEKLLTAASSSESLVRFFPG